MQIYKSIGFSLPENIQDFNYEQENQQLANRYHVRDYSGRVILFKAAERTHVSSAFADNELSWRSFAKNGLEVYHIPGNHLGMLQDPHVQILGEKLQGCLTELSSPSSENDQEDNAQAVK